MNGSVTFRPESRIATRTALCCHDGSSLEPFVAEGLINLSLKRVMFLKNSLAKSSVLLSRQALDRRLQGECHRSDLPSIRGQVPLVVQCCSQNFLYGYRFCRGFALNLLGLVLKPNARLLRLCITAQASGTRLTCSLIRITPVVTIGRC